MEEMVAQGGTAHNYRTNVVREYTINEKYSTTVC